MTVETNKELACDQCRTRLPVQERWHYPAIQQYGKKQGWACGSQDLCPNCRPAKRPAAMHVDEDGIWAAAEEAQGPHVALSMGNGVTDDETVLTAYLEPKEAIALAVELLTVASKKLANLEPPKA